MAAGRVLVIDDDPVISRMVCLLLGRQRYQVECYADAVLGIERAEADPPDVILLDIEMPGLSGIEACHRLRRNPLLSQVPVMFFSAGAKEQFIGQGFRAGAQDYLEKPCTEPELVARVANLARMARNEQSLRDAMCALRERNEALSRELEAASRVQAALLPTTLAPHPSLQCDRLYEPMVGVGGDLYDLALAPDGNVRFLIADVSGHGVFAALLAAFFKMGYQVYSDREASPARVLDAIHREVCRSLDSAHFITAMIGWLDPRSGLLRYSSAGHVPGLLRRAVSGTIERLMPTGPIVGIVEESRFQDSEVILEPGDSILLLTDGVLEAPNPSGEVYGLKRLLTLLARHPKSSPKEILQDLRIDLDGFQDETALDDDITALLFQWRPPV